MPTWRAAASRTRSSWIFFFFRRIINNCKREISVVCLRHRVSFFVLASRFCTWVLLQKAVRVFRESAVPFHVFVLFLFFFFFMSLSRGRMPLSLLFSRLLLTPFFSRERIFKCSYLCQASRRKKRKKKKAWWVHRVRRCRGEERPRLEVMKSYI